MIKSQLKDYQAETIRQLREKFSSIRPYLDHEIANAYCWYCQASHVASWSDVNQAEFVEWATSTPLKYYSMMTDKGKGEE